jgi:hypothetical protein
VYQVQLTVPAGLHHQGISAAERDIKSLELQSVLFAMLCIGSSISSELMNLGVLHLHVVRTLECLELCVTVGILL